MIKFVAGAVLPHWRLSLVGTSGFVLAYYVAQLLLLEVRFGHWPNYITVYDYPANVLRIIRHTPSVIDMIPIIADEWLLEVGYMNYDFGHGIAEWSLAVLPTKLLAVTLLGAVVGFNLLLWRRTQSICPMAQRPVVLGAAGMGAVLLGLTNVSLTWVVCCATPSWVVSLTLLGFDSALALSLLPYGVWLASIGALLLGAATAWLSWRSRVEVSTSIGTDEITPRSA
jgi:hypothetical protein